eukprot:TRINITY_DN318_c1_g2_i1.p1 TRINITY_DN318_c1_g2~~TRINITY_DN318_c1_g2_i1.p1  ORF type:complete len:561 (+),score=135.14 TRINITY_DN318_c1_g2_i1:22-1683(+)
MPPKKKEEPVEEAPKVPKYLDRVRENVLRGEGGEELCAEIMQDVVKMAEEQVLLNYFDRTAIPYTVQCVCKELLDLVQFVFVARDAGDMGKEAVASWAPDTEPSPCPTDTWARGAVPVRRKTEAAEYDLRATSTPNRKRDEKDRLKYQSSLKESNVLSQTITTSDTSRARATPSKALKNKEHNSSKTAAPEARETKDDDSLTAQKQEARRRAEMRDAAEKQNQTLRELKSGKEYIIDSINGKVIPVKNVDPKRLPSKRLDMKYEIESEGDRKQDEREQRKMSVAAVKPAPKKKPGKREEKTKWGEHVQPEDTHGPMVVGALPVGGVTLREGDNSQRNDIKNPKGKVSKTEYRKMLDAMGVSRGTVDMEQSEQNSKQVNAVPVPNPATPHEDAKQQDRLAAGTAFAAVIQQQPGQPTRTAPVMSSPSRPEPPIQQRKPQTYKPQQIAPIPSNRHTSNKGDLLHPKGRDRKIVFSPRQHERPAPLPPPLYPATQGHGKTTGELGRTNPFSDHSSNPQSQAGSPSAGIKIAADMEGNELTEDLLHSIYEDTREYNA